MLILESLLSKLLLMGATGKFAQAFLLLRQEKYFTSLFHLYEKAPIFDFDYLQKIEELPTKKMIALCAEVDSDSKGVKFGSLNHEKKVVFSSIIEEKKDDKFWKVENKDLDFHICNMVGDSIIVRNKEPLIFLYNLNKIEGPLSYKRLNLSLNLEQKLRAFVGKEIFFNEMAILPKNKYVFFGSFFKEGDFNYFEPECISGESKDLFLKYMDEYIVLINKKTRTTLIYSFAILFVHFIIVKLLLPYTRKATKEIQNKNK
jgi:hypothetical protein